jgi:hypothetical protein
MKQPGNKIKVLGKDNALWVENQRLKASIERVRELHKEVDANDSVCGDPDCCGEYIENWTMCADCSSDYPCPTIQALDGEANV